MSLPYPATPTQRWQRAKEIVADAIELPASERQAFIQIELARETHPENAMSLKIEIDSLLVEDTGSGIDFDAAKPPDFFMPAHAHNPAEIGQQIGVWQLADEIGRGGMGVVYRASRADGAYTQTVAIKFLHGRNTKDSRRLTRERQALAALSHPNIARLIDGGMHDNGTPYLVIEYVEGESIDQYCRTHQLGLNARVSLVQKICSAVQSAHQQLIIHRDIKPSNILVGRDGEPKLLDFGIARLIEENAQNDGAPDATLAGALLFTPRYASPEQVTGLPVSVATDVHGLGALLYELLVGTSPYPRMSTADTANMAAIMRIVAEDEAGRASEMARSATTDHAQFANALRGDLEIIMAKACARRIADRYQSVAELNDDLQRWRDNRPIRAKPQSWLYTTQKYLSRHRIASAATAAAIVASIIGVTTTLTEKNRANESYRQVRQLANSLIFDIYDKVQTLPGSADVRKEMVERATTFLDKQRDNTKNDADLAVELAAGYRRLGNVQFNATKHTHLGNRAKGDEAREKARVLLSEVLARDANHVEANLAMGWLERDFSALQAEDGNAVAAQKLSESAIQRYELALVKAPDNADARFMLAMFYVNRIDVAIQTKQAPHELVTKAREHYQKWLPGREDDPDNVNLQATILRKERRVVAEFDKDIPKAVKLAEDEITLLEKELLRYPNNHSYMRHINIAHHNAASMLITPDPQAALARFEKAMAHSEKLIALDTSDINTRAGYAGSFTRRGRAYLNLKQPTQAIADFRESAKHWEALPAVDIEHYMRRQQGESYWRLASSLRDTGNQKEARVAANKFIAHVDKYPTLFEKPPSADWVKEMRKMAESPL